MTTIVRFRCVPRGWRLACLVAFTALLGACSSTGTRAPSTDRQARPSGEATAGGARRPGGYYLDDGPGDRSMADVAAIPDAVPRAEPLLERANRPYTVFDRQYVPMVRLEPFRQRGVGSWYGRKYHGNRTSSGEVYDMYAMTAAHPTLPIPSYARVTNVANGRSAIVRVNDRGPFLHDRIVDLSFSAAARLGYAHSGSAEVELELITRFDGSAPAAMPASLPPVQVLRVADAGDAAMPPLERLDVQTVNGASDVAPSQSPSVATPAPASAGVPGAPNAAAPGVVWLQLGAFATRENAEALRARLVRVFGGSAERIDIRADGRGFKVQAGPYARRDEALAEAERLRSLTGVRPFPVAR